MRLCVFTRLLTAAATVLLAAPAFGQTADLAVTLTLATDSDPRTAGIPVGGAATFDVKVTNNGPTHVTEFQIDVAKDAALKFGAVAGCTKISTVATDPPFPCTVSISPGLLSGSSTTFTFDLEYPAPVPLNAATAACPSDPGPAPSFVTQVTISNVKQGTATVTDPTAANDTSSVTTHLRDWADLEIVSLDGPANTSEGQQVTYTVVATNLGPCTAKRVRVPFNFPATLTFVSSTTCTNVVGDTGYCTLGDVPKGTSPTFTATFTVNTYPKSVIKAAIPVDVDILSRSRAADPTVPVTAEAATDDPNGDNNAAATQATVDLSGNEGCSTGGAGTLFGLLSLAALRFRRRRSS